MQSGLRSWIPAAIIGAAAALIGCREADPEATARSAVSHAEAARAAETVTEADLARHLGVIAHDSMAGRDTPSPGLLATARYVEEKFRSLGLEPGTPDGYLQFYPVWTVRPAPTGQQGLVLRGPKRVYRLAHGKDWFAAASTRRAEVSAELATVQLAAKPESLAGRIALFRVGYADLKVLYGGRLQRTLTGLGAAGSVVALDLRRDSFQRLLVRNTSERALQEEEQGTPPPMAYVAYAALPPELADLLSRGERLPEGWSAELRTEPLVRAAEAPNVVGVLAGSDPDLRDEYVLFSAHMDHTGVGRPVDGDSIYNGADDNASGTVTIMELAEAFASLPTPPRRSVLFLLVSGEENGLLGSKWYVEHPTVPIGQVVANLNLDMVGRNWPDTIAAIGREESTLGPLAERIASEHPELDMAIVGDRWPGESFYTRSDHYEFARKGVPILFFFNGTHEDYHRPSDEVDRIDFEKMTRLGRLLFHIGWEVANADEPPRWDPEARARVVGSPGR